MTSGFRQENVTDEFSGRPPTVRCIHVETVCGTTTGSVDVFETGIEITRPDRNVTFETLGEGPLTSREALRGVVNLRETCGPREISKRLSKGMFRVLLSASRRGTRIFASSCVPLRFKPCKTLRARGSRLLDRKRPAHECPAENSNRKVSTTDSERLVHNDLTTIFWSQTL